MCKLISLYSNNKLSLAMFIQRIAISDRATESLIAAAKYQYFAAIVLVALQIKREVCFASIMQARFRRECN